MGFIYSSHLNYDQTEKQFNYSNCQGMGKIWLQNGKRKLDGWEGFMTNKWI